MHWPVSLNKKYLPFFCFHIFCIVLRLNSGCMFLEISEVPSPLRYRGFYCGDYSSRVSRVILAGEWGKCEIQRRQTLKTLKADPSSSLAPNEKNAPVSTIGGLVEFMEKIRSRVVRNRIYRILLFASESKSET
jgi:hypothetical protein